MQKQRTEAEIIAALDREAELRCEDEQEMQDEQDQDQDIQAEHDALVRESQAQDLAEDVDILRGLYKKWREQGYSHGQATARAKADFSGSDWRPGGAPTSKDAFKDYNPDLWTADALARNENYKLKPWVVEGLVRLGTTLIVPGESGGGKSALMLALSKAVAEGHAEFLGLKITSPGSVLFISQDTFAADIVEVAARAKSKFHIWPRLGVCLVKMKGTEVVRDEEGYRRILRHCDIMRSRGKPVMLIVLDTLSAVARVGLNENHIAFTVMEVARQVAEATGTAVAYIHHPTKADQKTGNRQIISGGYQLQGNTDFVLNVKLVASNPGQRLLRIDLPKQRSEKEVQPFVATYTFLRDGQKVLEFEREENLDPEVVDSDNETLAALEWTDKDGPKTAAQIAAHLWPGAKDAAEAKARARKARRLIDARPSLWIEDGKDGNAARYRRRPRAVLKGTEHRTEHGVLPDGPVSQGVDTTQDNAPTG